MKSLDTLIRLQKFELDEKRRKLAELQGLRDDMAARIERLEAQMKTEAVNALGNDEVGFAYANYISAALDRRKTMLTSLDELDQRVLAARDEVAEAFQEVKKYEVARENRQKRERAERLKRENETLDEVGVGAFTRRQAEATLLG